MRLAHNLSDRLKEGANNLLLIAAVIAGVASIAVGYSKIRESQVASEIKLALLEKRLERVEDKLDKAYGWVQEGADIKP